MDYYEQFVFDLKRKLNFDLNGYKRPQMERRINTLMRTLGIKNYQEFIEVMERDRSIYERFYSHITINVSEFFRNPNQWTVFQNKVLPMLIQKSPNLKIWSAGCSTGEEPYTAAMILAESVPGQHSILATDLDENVLAQAKKGNYPQQKVSGIPSMYLQKYWLRQQDNYQAKEELMKMISFKKHNLLSDQYASSFDIIICRNVVIYFTEDSKKIIYNKFFNALKPGGVLFTGSTEHIVQAREIGYENNAIFFYSRPLL